MHGLVRHGMFKLRANLTLDARLSASFEPKVFRDQRTDGPGIYFASI